eukprot:CAMPEP_0116911242 /NCGR_PEP_ID=MMETSP0467-20121206/15369_1 /TAXON_ID=283647 /ORGANISM="Mesodinium pulex, Strain SPMC105" /LENGTH=76 /DNA_ID=CAMNT_0004586983 /DNA_START=490 /DNA_END=720 /DNA_ORIENTATION=+
MESHVVTNIHDMEAKLKEKMDKQKKRNQELSPESNIINKDEVAKIKKEIDINDLEKHTTMDKIRESRKKNRFGKQA